VHKNQVERVECKVESVSPSSQWLTAQAAIADTADFQKCFSQHFQFSIFNFPLILLLLVSSLFAQDLQIKSSVNPSQIHIGDRFAYHVEVNAPENFSVDLPELVGNLGSFEVKDVKVQESKPATGRRLRTWDLTLSTFVGGDFLLPPQVVEAIQGKDTLRTHTEAVAVRVLSRVNEKDDDVLEVEAPMKDPHTPWWVWAIVGVVGAVALFFLGKYLWKALKKPVEIPALPPYEEALKALAELRAQRLLELGDQAAHFFVQGQILRRYLNRQFNADVLDATTSELAERVQSITQLSEPMRKAWIEYARETDLVKFAKFALTEEDVRKFETFADHFLHETRPLSWEQGAPKPGASKQGSPSAESHKSEPTNVESLKSESSKSEPSTQEEAH